MPASQQSPNLPATRGTACVLYPRLPVRGPALSASCPCLGLPYGRRGVLRKTRGRPLCLHGSIPSTCILKIRGGGDRRERRREQNLSAPLWFEVAIALSARARRRELCGSPCKLHFIRCGCFCLAFSPSASLHLVLLTVWRPLLPPFCSAVGCHGPRFRAQ